MTQLASSCRDPRRHLIDELLSSAFFRACSRAAQIRHALLGLNCHCGIEFAVRDGFPNVGVIGGAGIATLRGRLLCLGNKFLKETDTMKFDLQKALRMMAAAGCVFFGGSAVLAQNGQSNDSEQRQNQSQGQNHDQSRDQDRQHQGQDQADGRQNQRGSDNSSQTSRGSSNSRLQSQRSQSGRSWNDDNTSGQKFSNSELYGRQSHGRRDSSQDPQRGFGGPYESQWESGRGTLQSSNMSGDDYGSDDARGEYGRSGPGQQDVRRQLDSLERQVQQIHREVDQLRRSLSGSDSYGRRERQAGYSEDDNNRNEDVSTSYRYEGGQARGDGFSRTTYRDGYRGQETDQDNSPGGVGGGARTRPESDWNDNR
jgi:hypothetical protein